MTNRANVGYRIRNYEEADAGKIGEFDYLLELSYRYNPDYVPENIFCAVNPDGGILGVGHLEPHDSWNLIDRENMPPDAVYKLVLGISINHSLQSPNDLKADLVRTLAARAQEIRLQYPNKKIRVFRWVASDNFMEMDFLLSQGFTAFQNSLVLKYDLTQEIREVKKPDGIMVAARKLETEEELHQLREAEATAFSGIVWSMNLLRWYRGAPEWLHFSAFNEDQLIGNTMTWLITEERSAVENIFVLPEWRGKGVASYMITEALKYLKSQGKSIATLSVYGDNKKAIALYTALGFRMFGTILEFGIEG